MWYTGKQLNVLLKSVEKKGYQLDGWTLCHLHTHTKYVKFINFKLMIDYSVSVCVCLNWFQNNTYISLRSLWRSFIIYVLSVVTIKQKSLIRPSVNVSSIYAYQSNDCNWLQWVLIFQWIECVCIWLLFFFIRNIKYQVLLFYLQPLLVIYLTLTVFLVVLFCFLFGFLRRISV